MRYIIISITDPGAQRLRHLSSPSAILSFNRNKRRSSRGAICVRRSPAVQRGVPASCPVFGTTSKASLPGRTCPRRGSRGVAGQELPQPGSNATRAPTATGGACCRRQRGRAAPRGSRVRLGMRRRWPQRWCSSAAQEVGIPDPAAGKRLTGWGRAQSQIQYVCFKYLDIN